MKWMGPVVAAAAFVVVGCEQKSVFEGEERARAAEATSPEDARRGVLEYQADALRHQADLQQEVAEQRQKILDMRAKVFDQQAQIDRERDELERLESEAEQARLRYQQTVEQNQQVLETPRPQVEQQPLEPPPQERVEVETIPAPVRD